MNTDSFLQRFLFSIAPEKKPQIITSRPLKKAAVLVPLVERENGLHIILTQRALHLRHHPGQVSFPGGKYEQFDNTLKQTACRETEEEIGISPQFINLIGKLPSLNTVSGFHVSPFIALINENFILKVDTQEVKTVFEVPLNYLLDPKNIHKQHLIANKKRHFTYCIGFQNHLIWGATAQIIKNLQQLIAPH